MTPSPGSGAIGEKIMTRTSRIAWLLVAVSSIITTSQGQAQQAPIVMKLGTATINDTQHEWMRRFASEVKQDS